MHTTKYRPDIDGLRGIAILSVLLFHFQFPFSRAGFSGVDVFFVISGYLITGSSLASVESWRDVADFFRRRIARLLPMVTLTCIAVVGASAALLSALNAHEAFRLARYVSFFWSNNYLFSKADYFNLSANTNPFLHTWSLGVEEQFYVLIPFVLMFVRRRVALFASVALVSFVLAVFVAKAPGAFYLLPCRAWQFATGALLVSATAPKTERSARFAFVVGAVLLACGFSLLESSFEQSPAYRVFPTLAAAAIIWAGRADNAFSRALGSKPFAWVGALSFSVYLIHWPAWVFIAVPSERELSLLAKGAMLVGVFGVGHFAFRFIERPLQTRLRRMSLRNVFVAAAGMIGLTIAISYAGAAKIPKPFIYAETVEQSGTCFLHLEHTVKNYVEGECIPEQKERRVLLWGDSFAAHYFFGLKRRLHPDMVLFQATNAGCTPLLDARKLKRCRDFTNYVLSELIPKTKPEVVVLAGRWDGDDTALGREAVMDSLRQIADRVRARGARLVLVGASPIFHTDVGQVYQRRVNVENKEEAFELPAQLFDDLNAEMAEFAKERGIVFFDARKVFCHGTMCSAASALGPYFNDTGHFSRDGSLMVSESLARLMEK